MKRTIAVSFECPYAVPCDEIDLQCYCKDRIWKILAKELPPLVGGAYTQDRNGPRAPQLTLETK